MFLLALFTTVQRSPRPVTGGGSRRGLNLMSGKTFLLCLFFLLAGLTAGLVLNFYVITAPAPDTVIFQDEMVSAQVGSKISSTLFPATAASETGNIGLMLRSISALRLIRDRDYAGLSQMVHPKKGVSFTPYSTVDSEANLSFTPAELVSAQKNGAQYIWGLSDGQGEPITLTVDQYFDQFVFNTDYTQAPMVGLNRVIGSGNSLENVAEAYPEAQFVEYHFPGLVEANQGFDWCSLKLVFELYDGEYMLIGIIHSQWTI